MRRKRPDPLLLIIVFVSLGLIITSLSMDFRLPWPAGTLANTPAPLLADDTRTGPR